MLSGIDQLFIFLYQFLKYQAFAQVFSLCIGASNNLTVTIPEFVLIILLIILL